jgi:hypothetical protein
VPQLAFIDIEAFGLTEDSYPIEVGWAVLGGTSGALLVKPAPDWSRDEWDDLAEAKHGISWDVLMQRGVPREQAVTRLNRELPVGTLVLTDAFEWDGYWLSQLFEPSAGAQSFQLGDYWRSLAMVADRGRFERARQSYAHSARKHRAGDDALEFRTLWIEATT